MIWTGSSRATMSASSPTAFDHSGMTGTVLAIDRNPLKVLTDPALASLHGGDIPVRAPGQTLVPQGGFFRVTIRLDGIAPDTVQISGQGQSMIGRSARSALVVLVRKWGV